MAVVHRVVDWFWQTSAERALRAAGQGASPLVLGLTARAILAREAAERTLRPAEPFSQPGHESVACALYRQAVHWALLAHDAVAVEAAPPADGAVTPASDLASLFERVDRALLSRAAGGDAALDELRAALAGSDYREFAELAPAAQKGLAERLDSFCRGVTEALEARRQQLERLWVRRVVHVLALLAVLGAAVWGVRALSAWNERRNDLAAHAAWKTSSSYPVGGCKSPEQHCAGGENYFFHTNQETNPWIQFDLHKEREISGVEIENRLDCCPERASPLVVEVSNDQRRWKQVARHTGEFTTLRKHFGTVKARYVRLVVQQQSAILHLSRVRIFP